MSEKKIGAIRYFHTGEKKIRLKPISTAREDIAEEEYKLPEKVEITLKGEEYSIGNLIGGDIVSVEFTVEGEEKVINSIDVQIVSGPEVRAESKCCANDGVNLCCIECPVGKAAYCQKRPYLQCRCV